MAVFFKILDFTSLTSYRTDIPTFGPVLYNFCFHFLTSLQLVTSYMYLFTFRRPIFSRSPFFDRKREFFNRRNVVLWRNIFLVSRFAKHFREIGARPVDSSLFDIFFDMPFWDQYCKQERRSGRKKIISLATNSLSLAGEGRRGHQHFSSLWRGL